MSMTMQNGYGQPSLPRVLSPGEVIEDDIPSTQEQEFRPNLAVRLICKECLIDPPNLVEECVGPYDPYSLLYEVILTMTKQI